MRILLVEDEAPKRANVRSLVEGMNINAVITEARSVGSAIRQLRRETFELVLLDMSLPTFDVGAGESGGRPQGFGGIEVLRYMDRFKVTAPAIVITAYPAFASGDQEIDLSSLSEKLKIDHPHSFSDLVFYNSMFSTWRVELEEMVRKALTL